MTRRAKPNPRNVGAVMLEQSVTPQDAIEFLVRCGPWVAVTAAVKLLKLSNHNLAADAVCALTQEGRGEVFRAGRDLSIMLPEHWAETKTDA